MCKVEWKPINDESGKVIQITDSEINYQEIRLKAPHLLCDFFERNT